VNVYDRRRSVNIYTYIILYRCIKLLYYNIYVLYSYHYNSNDLVTNISYWKTQYIIILYTNAFWGGGGVAMSVLREGEIVNKRNGDISG